MKPHECTPAQIAATKRQMALEHSKIIAILKCAQTHGFTINTLVGSATFNHHAWGDDFNTNSIPGQAMQRLIDWQQETHKFLAAVMAPERVAASLPPFGPGNYPKFG